jgi:hypothetical protein
MADAGAVFSALPRADASARLGLSLLFPIMSGGVVAVAVKRSASTVAAAFVQRANQKRPQAILL